MLIEKALLSKRFKNDGLASVDLDPIAKDALSRLIDDIANKKINLADHNVCPLCGNKRAKLIAEKDRLGIPSKTVICDCCGLVFNDSYFDEHSSRIFYETYWRKIQWSDPRKNFLNRIRPDAYSWKRFAFIALHLGENFKRIKTVLEIGCGDGCNLLPFHLSGKEICGCDFDEDCLNEGRQNGMNLIKGDVSALANYAGKADLIILSHVLEHFLDIDKEFVYIRELLRPEGFLYAEVPGILNLNRKRSHFRSEDGYRSGNSFLMYLQCVHNE